MEELARSIQALNLRNTTASDDRRPYDSIDWSYDPTAMHDYRRLGSTSQSSYRNDYGVGTSGPTAPYPSSIYGTSSLDVVDVYSLMTERYGATFCNLLRRGDCRLISRIVDLVARDQAVLIQVAKERFGVFTAVMFIDFVSAYPILGERVMSVLANIVLRIMTDAEAWRLVLHSLMKLDYGKNSYLFEAASNHCRMLAKDETGINALNACIRFAREPDRRRILYRIARCSVDLAKHSNGNRLLQHILENYDREVSVNMCLMFLEGHLEELSENSHGSHVLEKCLQSHGRGLILNGLASFEKEKLKELAEDSFGNYVIQTALRTQPSFLRDRLYAKIREIAPELHVNKFTRKIAMLIS